MDHHGCEPRRDNVMYRFIESTTMGRDRNSHPWSHLGVISHFQCTMEKRKRKILLIESVKCRDPCFVIVGTDRLGLGESWGEYKGPAHISTRKDEKGNTYRPREECADGAMDLHFHSLLPESVWSLPLVGTATRSAPHDLPSIPTWFQMSLILKAV